MNHRWKPRQKPRPFWWAHRANASNALADMGEMTASIFERGEGEETAYCAVKQAGKAVLYWCDDMRWHTAKDMAEVPEIEVVRR